MIYLLLLLALAACVAPQTYSPPEIRGPGYLPAYPPYNQGECR